jgi:UDP-GlcNAc3NAcA epimerase
LKAVSVVGTRPQLVKAAVVTRALREHRGFDEVTVDTGQHYDHEMSALLLADLSDVRRARDLDLHGGTEHSLLGRMLAAIGDMLAEERPDVVVVYGDTSSTLAAALAATSVGVPVAHVEAGLRSFNRAMREERNRVVTDHVADVLLCPTPTAVRNLAAEGVTRGVHHVGDVMYDAALAARAVVDADPEALGALLDRLGVADGPFAVATVHRAETTDDHEVLREVIAYLVAEAGSRTIVFPVHPRTRKEMESAGIEAAALDRAGLLTCAPLGYFDMTRLLFRAECVYTDSGGLQKEAYFHRVPCVTLRAETEWTETVESGWNRLWKGPEHRPRREIADYGDGRAGAAIARVLAQEFGPISRGA